MSFSGAKINELDLSHATQLKIIGSYAFSYCSELSRLFLPEGLKIISDYAFSGNSKLISFELPSTITHIYRYAFSGCINLLRITFRGSQLEYIGYMAFYNTKMSPFVIPSSVSNITNPGVNWSINENHPNLYEKNGLIYSKNNENLFLYNGTNEYIDLEENVKVIQDYCFYQCDSLISINIPSNLDRIGIYAFCNCKELKSLKINSVNFIDMFAFGSCVMLNIFEISQCSNPGIFSNGCITGTSLTDIKLPNGLKILKYHSLAGNKNLESVYLPPTVTQIYDYTFNGCTNLTEIIIAPDSQLDYIGFLALNNTKIKTFHITNSISNITYLGINDWTVDSNHPYFIEKDGLLYSRNKEIIWIYKGNIENVIIENDLKQINERCFYHCNTLKTVVGQNVELIGKQSFESCKNVTSINFKNVGIIGEDAFTSCSNLEYFSITNLKGMYYTDFNMPLRYCNKVAG